VQNDSGVIHVVAEDMRDATPLLARLSDGPPPEATARADAVKRPHEDLDPRDKAAHRPQLARLIAEMSAPGGDLDQPAHATRQLPLRKGKPRAAPPPAPEADRRSEKTWPKGRNFR
jgi:hypothetical protein